MVNNGYIIARTKNASEFFTSSSAYDRPKWVKINEATKYVTVELAERALTKLVKNGMAYEARLVSLQEAMDMEFSNDEKIKPPHRGSVGSPTDNAYPSGDLASDPGGDGSEDMTADDQDEVCPECEHEPCTCAGQEDESGHVTCPSCGEEVPLGSDESGSDMEGLDGIDSDPEANHEDQLDLELEDPDGEFNDKKRMGEAYCHSDDLRRQEAQEADRLKRLSPTWKKDKEEFDAKVAAEKKDLEIKRKQMVQGAVSKLEQKFGTKKLRENEFKMPTKPLADAQPSENNTTAATYGKPPKIKFKQTLQTGEFDMGGDSHDTKVTVPANVMSDLKALLKEVEGKITRNSKHDEGDASFNMTVADALKTLLSDLEIGTVEGMKQAQITIDGWMSPIRSMLPPSVVKFVARGGTKPSLKDLFSDKTLEKKGE